MSKQIFTIEPRQSGFTDQLVEFKALYKLGLSLGYTFYFQPFKSPRSANIDGRGLPMTFMDLDHKRPSLWQRAVSKMKRSAPILREMFQPPEPFDVYDFTGFNDYFLARNDDRLVEGLEEIILPVAPDFAGSVDKDDFPALQEFVCEQVDRLKNDTAKFILKFKVIDRAGIFFESINTAVADPFDLWAIYFEKRQQEPLPSVYPSGQMKTFIHIRQGDTAIIDTPWNSYIILWPVHQAEEYGRWQDIPYKDMLVRIEDFNRFYRELAAQLSEGTLSTLLFSDGFVRSERRLFNHMKFLDLTEQQKHDLRAAVHTFNDKKFRIFPNNEHFKMIVGESPQKLRNFIHSFLTADLVIGGRNQTMIAKLLHLYCNQQNMPLTILLDGSPDHKVVKGMLDHWVDEDMQENIMLVNVNQIDMVAISAKVGSFLKV